MLSWIKTGKLLELRDQQNATWDLIKSRTHTPQKIYANDAEAEDLMAFGTVGSPFFMLFFSINYLHSIICTIDLIYSNEWNQGWSCWLGLSNGHGRRR